MTATQRGLERERFLAFVQMTSNGATKDEAYVYIDLIWPLAKGKEVMKDEATVGCRTGRAESSRVGRGVQRTSGSDTFAAAPDPTGQSA